jgi:hypothetical protein
MAALHKVPLRAVRKTPNYPASGAMIAFVLNRLKKEYRNGRL